MASTARWAMALPVPRAAPGGQEVCVGGGEEGSGQGDVGEGSGGMCGRWGVDCHCVFIACSHDLRRWCAALQGHLMWGLDVGCLYSNMHHSAVQGLHLGPKPLCTCVHTLSAQTHIIYYKLCNDTSNRHLTLHNTAHQSRHEATTTAALGHGWRRSMCACMVGRRNINEDQLSTTTLPHKHGLPRACQQC
jgi:hypothetical protein